MPPQTWDAESIKKIIYDFAHIDQITTKMLSARDLTIFEVVVFCENLDDIPHSINITLEMQGI